MTRVTFVKVYEQIPNRYVEGSFMIKVDYAHLPLSTILSHYNDTFITYLRLMWLDEYERLFCSCNTPTKACN